MKAMKDNYPIKTLLFKNMEEARKVLFDTYQNRYEIVNKREILTGGFFGLGQKEKLEISFRVKDFPENFSKMPSYGSSLSSVGAENDQAAFMRNQNDLLQKLAANSVQPASISTQLNEFAKQLQELNRKIDEKPVASVNASSDEGHSSIEKIEDLLSENEFTHSYIKQIRNRLKATFSLEKLDDFSRVQRAVVDWIGEDIKVEHEVTIRKPRTVIIVGPTGVGKTTTLVKLAAQNVIAAKNNSKKLQLCFITTDSMRVGAMEQLSRYADMFNLSVQKAESVEDVKKIYEDVRYSVDMIFIDTSGYSPNDSSHIGALKATLDVPGMNPEVYLAVMASTKTSDLINIMQNYEPFGYKSVIITKCDESRHFGNVISALAEKNKSISYITNGQKVGRCIEKANPIEFLIRLENFEVDRIHIEDKFGEN